MKNKTIFVNNFRQFWNIYFRMDVRKLKSLEQDEVEKLLWFQTAGSETEEEYSELDHSAMRKLAKKTESCNQS